MRERAKVLLTVFALVVFMASPAPAAPAAITIERIVAKINQEIITLSTLQDFVFEEVKISVKNTKARSLSGKSAISSCARSMY